MKCYARQTDPVAASLVFHEAADAPSDLPPMPTGPELLDHRRPGLAKKRLAIGRPLLARLPGWAMKGNSNRLTMV